MIVSLIGAALILLSVPLKWEESYVTGLGRPGGTSIFSGWFVVIEAIVILGLVISELQTPDEKPTTQAGIVAFLCLMTLLFALFTLFGVLMVGSSQHGGITAGIRTGPGLWLAILGALVCAGGQGLAIGFDPPLLTGTQSSRRCAKCGTGLPDSATAPKECPACGASWSSPDAPPPLPGNTPMAAQTKRHISG